MSDTPVPDIHEPTREAAEALLQRHNVGRLAYMLRNQVEIVPIHYVYESGWIYVRSAMGQKLIALQGSPWVAFEVDEVESPTSWMSVVVHGTAQLLDPQGPPREMEALRRAIAALRSADPRALSEGDSRPERNFVMRISVNRITARASTPTGTESSPGGE